MASAFACRATLLAPNYVDILLLVKHKFLLMIPATMCYYKGVAWWLFSNAIVLST